MKVLMSPNPANADSYAASGITTVLRDYARFAAAVEIEFVDENAESFDVLAVHAGMSNFMTDAPYVSHCHGLYWTGDYQASSWEYKANRDVISSLRRATLVTVPSQWVGVAIQRDMHLDPFVLPHAIDPLLWQAKPVERKYVLWNKNRAGDVCDPTPVRELALRFPDTHFLATFAPADTPPNVLVTGSMPHSEMREVVMGAHIYLATTKETFGIGLLEARASGVPILAYNEGGAADIVEHGVDGYLARPGDIMDLSRGLEYCLRYHDDLSANALQHAHRDTWPSVMVKLRNVYNMAIGKSTLYSKGVSVVIPCYNYAHTLTRAVESALKQELEPHQVIIVDDGSTDDTPIIAEQLLQLYPGKIRYIRTENQGVALARNTGMREVWTQYACCLDADDEIMPEFLSICTRALDRDCELGLAYTRLTTVSSDGSSRLSDWPTHYHFSGFLKHQNQVPTCCVFRSDIFRRAGGFRARYAPTGAGSEDANLWLRMGALGYGGILASEEGHFRYHLGGRVSNEPSYREVDWLSPYPWAKDGQHPLASVAQSKGLSHEVYQYDVAEISVVIPCSAGHLSVLCDAVDSIEGQSFRYWEIVVVFDGDVANHPDYLDFRRTYPFVRTFHLPDSQGAGVARNLGALHTIGKYLLFLDADDWLDPFCLEKMYAQISTETSIIYSDYIGHAVMDEAEAHKLGKRLLDYESKTQMASVYHNSANYDCALAQRQPLVDGKGQFYIWNIITSLMPKKWHDEIGGFDETMQSWEDWDYWIRLAQMGKCFIRIEQPLVHYRFYTGQRREIGRQAYPDLLDYMKGKYKEVELMPCGGCKGRTAQTKSTVNHNAPSMMMERMTMAADSLITVELIDGNIAKHPISMRDADGTLHKYGYRQHGEQFLMRRDHFERYRNKFRIVDEQPKQYAQDVTEPDVDLPPPPANVTPLQVFTSSEQDKDVAHAQRDERIRPVPPVRQNKKPGPKPRRGN